MPAGGEPEPTSGEWNAQPTCQWPVSKVPILSSRLGQGARLSVGLGAARRPGPPGLHRACMTTVASISLSLGGTQQAAHDPEAGLSTGSNAPAALVTPIHGPISLSFFLAEWHT
jgi:hypothetical protein